jgi:hypothetical protein
MLMDGRWKCAERDEKDVKLSSSDGDEEKKMKKGERRYLCVFKLAKSDKGKSVNNGRNESESNISKSGDGSWLVVRQRRKGELRF